MKHYIVRWEIELDATSALAAAKHAQQIQHDENSIATVFHVVEKGNDPSYIDLSSRPPAPVGRYKKRRNR